MLSTAVTECPAKAIQLLHYRDVQVEAEIAEAGISEEPGAGAVGQLAVLPR